MRWLALILILLPLPGHAGLMENALVKMTSSSKAHTFNGSGLGFRVGNRAFIVTSDHVVLHENTRVENRILSGEHALSATLVASDFGRGLALLEISSDPMPDDISWPGLESLRAASPAIGDPVTMIGFPAMSDSFIRDPRARIKAPAAASSIFLEIPALVEIENGHGEFGMSGGVAASAKGELTGILSHQVFEKNNLILAIPGADVIKWVQGFFPGGQAPATPVNPMIHFVQTTGQMLSKETPSFSSGQLNFYLLDAYANGRKVLAVLLAARSVSALYPDLPPGQEGLLHKIQKDLLKHTDCHVNIIGYKYSNGRTIGSPQSIRGHVQQWADPTTQPDLDIFCKGNDEVAPWLRK